MKLMKLAIIHLGLSSKSTGITSTKKGELNQHRVLEMDD